MWQQLSNLPQPGGHPAAVRHTTPCHCWWGTTSRGWSHASLPTLSLEGASGHVALQSGPDLLPCCLRQSSTCQCLSICKGGAVCMLAKAWASPSCCSCRHQSDLCSPVYLQTQHVQTERGPARTRCLCPCGVCPCRPLPRHRSEWLPLPDSVPLTSLQTTRRPTSPCPTPALLPLGPLPHQPCNVLLTQT